METIRTRAKIWKKGGMIMAVYLELPTREQFWHLSCLMLLQGKNRSIPKPSTKLLSGPLKNAAIDELEVICLEGIDRYKDI